MDGAVASLGHQIQILPGFSGGEGRGKGEGREGGRGGRGRGHSTSGGGGGGERGGGGGGGGGRGLFLFVGDLRATDVGDQGAHHFCVSAGAGDDEGGHA